MAYKADYGVKSVHGTNPQNLIEHIVRERIFASAYWKEECFGLNAAALAKRAMNLTYVGGTWGGHRRPTPFLCLLLKMLMIQPDMDIVEAFISEKDFRYVRLLGAFYLRLVGTGVEIYKCLETLYSDNRKFKFRQLDGTFTVDYIDNFVDSLLTTVRVCDTTLPPLVARNVLMDRGKLGKRVSLLDDMLLEEESDEESAPASHRGADWSDDDHPTQAKSKIAYSKGDGDQSPSDQERGRSRFRTISPRSSPGSSPKRSLSTKRTGFRSPSPSHGDSRYELTNNEDISHLSATASSPIRSAISPSRRGSPSPTRRDSAVSPREGRRGQPSPDVSPSRSRRGNRSPDAPPSARKGERSPDARGISPRRGERSPDRYDSRNESPRRGRRDDSPDFSRYRRQDHSPVYSRRKSPDRRDDDRYRDGLRRYDSRDDRRGFDRKPDRYSEYDDHQYSKKRGRPYDDRYEDDRYAEPKRPRYDEDHNRSSAPKSSHGGGGGGKKGGLREMSVDEMNELRKSIGLGPLKS